MVSRKKDVSVDTVFETLMVETRHVFLDIVGYTRERTVEAQTEIISELNAIVKRAVNACKINDAQVIYIPTGDGMCISLLDLNPKSLELDLALKILELVNLKKSKEKDSRRQFDIRISINGNQDNVVTDINGNRNIAGEGISMASRILNFADGNQILMGEWNHELYKKREKYFGKFRVLENCEIKHGYRINIFQYIDENFVFLNTAVPKAFAEDVNQEMNAIAKHYLEICQKESAKIAEFLGKVKMKEKVLESLRVAIYHAACDAFDKREGKKLSVTRIRKNIFNQQELYLLTYRDILLDLDEEIRENKLKGLSKKMKSDFLTLIDA